MSRLLGIERKQTALMPVNKRRWCWSFARNGTGTALVPVIREMPLVPVIRKKGVGRLGKNGVGAGRTALVPVTRKRTALVRERRWCLTALVPVTRK
jgi:hypothetical protein